MRNDAPIGVFDSGVGGLTVAREIMRQLPDERLVYFGDTARVPYGSKSRDTIIHFVRQIIAFLRTKDVKAIVFACNTASAYALSTINEEIDIPIIGVVRPGARTAVRTTRNKKIGVIATDATINSGLYRDYIRDLDPSIEVHGKACPLFVPLVEEGLTHDIVTEIIAKRYLQEFKDDGVDTLILGCTHYPLLRSLIRGIMGETVQLVNPAYETAIALKALLTENGIAAPGSDVTGGNVIESGTSASAKIENAPAGSASASASSGDPCAGSARGRHEFFVSDGAEKFRVFANSILPLQVEETKIVNIEKY